MQHVYSHAQNIGNECADHAAALGTFDLVSNQHISTRWAHPSFDSNLNFAPCHNLSDVSNKLRDVRTARASARLEASILFRIVSLRGQPCFVYVPL